MSEHVLVPAEGNNASVRAVRAATKNLGLRLYLVFVVSWFLHMPARFPVLGTIRFDLLLVVAMSTVALLNRAEMGDRSANVDKWLRILIAYSILTIPFVEWPGSVIRSGIPDLIKVIAFYYFTIAFVKTEKDLKQFISVFVLCQLWRIMEPLYLHLTTGYWGDKAYQAGGDFLNRLSGAPHDIVNPNGLAFVICTVVCFIYFLGGLSWKRRLVVLGVAPLCIYALILTGSRSGLVGLGIVFIAILIKSTTKIRILLLSAVTVSALVSFPLLDPDMQDRYLSLVGMGQKNEATVALRFEGIEDGINVWLRRPFLGYGLGTSLEANFHYGWRAQPTHNIYVEVAQELGIIGLLIFMRFMVTIFQGFLTLRQRLRESNAAPMFHKTVDALQTWLAMAFVFSFASYGLLSYEWYLLGGLLIAIGKQIQSKSTVGAGQYPRSAELRYARQRNVRPQAPRNPALGYERSH